MVWAKLCFEFPKGRKVRDVPLPSSVARAIRQHMEYSHFLPRAGARGSAAIGASFA